MRTTLYVLSCVVNIETLLLLFSFRFAVIVEPCDAQIKAIKKMMYSQPDTCFHIIYSGSSLKQNNMQFMHLLGLCVSIFVQILKPRVHGCVTNRKWLSIWSCCPQLWDSLRLSRKTLSSGLKLIFLDQSALSPALFCFPSLFAELLRITASSFGRLCTLSSRKKLRLFGRRSGWSIETVQECRPRWLHILSSHKLTLLKEVW